MVFSSPIFLFAFLPAVFLLHALLPGTRARNVLLAGASLVFYAFGQLGYLPLFLISVLFNYLAGRLLAGRRKKSRAVLAAAVVVNLGLLGVYKYADFVLAMFSLPTPGLLLPIGISFYTFQGLSYVIDVYREPESGTRDFGKLLLYLAFFPQLIAGPIVKYHEIAPQLDERSCSPEQTEAGILRFVWGLGKKLLLADAIGAIADPVFTGGTGDVRLAWLGALCYTLQIYYDFSGYCDMAVGLGRMFNFSIPENFNSPYKSHSVPEYWTRWHATLTRFFTNYIYTPILMHGVRKKKRKQYILITPLIVYFISGFWHGASWTFIIWGMMQGIATVWSQRKFLKIRNRFVTWFCTFFFTIVTQVVFRSETIPNMLSILKAMFVPHLTGYVLDIGSTMSLIPAFKGALEVVLRINISVLYHVYTLILVLSFVLAGLILHGPNSGEIQIKAKEKGYGTLFTLALGLLFAWCLVSMTGLSTFLYFNF